MNKTEEMKRILEELKEKIKKEGEKIVATDVEVVRVFIRRDGFSNSDKSAYDILTREQFAYLTRREWKIPVKIDLSADEPYPPYMNTDKITFYPIRHEWETKNKLNIFYEER